MPKRLSDEETYDLLHEMTVIARGKRGESDIADSAITNVRFMIDIIQQSLIMKMDSIEERNPPPEMITLKVRMPREAHAGLVRFASDYEPPMTPQVAAVFAIGAFLRQTGNFAVAPDPDFPNQVTVLLPEYLLQALDEARDKEPDHPSRPEMIRRILDSL